MVSSNRRTTLGTWISGCAKGCYIARREWRNGEAWTGGMSSDRVVRLDSKTDQTIEYPLPHRTNIRRVHVDDSKSPATLWVGNTNSASIVKVEPLD